MLASLPMYDLPEIRASTDGFWQSIATFYGAEGPLTRGRNWSGPWHDPNLLFSQTCGYPFTHEFAGQLTYLATPHYKADGCEGPNYCSIIFARNEAKLVEFKNHKACFNSDDSMSGHLALKLVFATVHKENEQTFFSSAIKTGSHVASLAAVQNGVADACAIDCVTVALLARHRPTALQGLVEIARSPKVPTLPYVTRSSDQQQLQHALVAAVQSLDKKNPLLIESVSMLAPDDYNVIVELENAIASIKVLPKA